MFSTKRLHGGTLHSPLSGGGDAGRSSAMRGPPSQQEDAARTRSIP